MADGGPPPVNPIDQAGMEAALDRQERIRKSTELPLFYAQKERDVCTAELFMERFEVAAMIARWILPEGQPDRYARTCREFYLLLRGNALKWWASLDNCLDFDKTDWLSVRARFLESYAKQYTATSACTGLAEMRQKTGEGVQDYFVRCNEIYDRIKEIRPAALQQWRGAVPAAPAGQAFAAGDRLNQGKEQGVKEMGLFFLHLLFIAGLREDIRLKTMELNDQSLEAARLSAKRVELLLQDKKNLKVSALRWDGEEEEAYDNEDMSDEEYLDMTEDEIGQLNAIRAQQGKRPIRRPNFKRNFKGIMCYYCGLKGHYQKVCRKRIREKGAIVHKANQTNNIGEPKGQDQEEEEVAASMAISEFYNCNAISLN
jgi:Retrotransposon gag protein